MNKIELIDRAELMEKLRIVFPCSSCWEKKEPCIGLCYSVKMAVMLTPTIDAAPVRRGEWMVTPHKERFNFGWNATAKCSKCGYNKGEIWGGYFPVGISDEVIEQIVVDNAENVKMPHFCPNCGADMRREEHRP